MDEDDVALGTPGARNRSRQREFYTRRMRYTRLTEPLVRDGGTLRPASWDEALDAAAAGFRRALEAGHETGLFSCSKATNEVNFAAQKLSRLAFRSNNVDSCNRT